MKFPVARAGIAILFTGTVMGVSWLLFRATVGESGDRAALPSGEVSHATESAALLPTLDDDGLVPEASVESLLLRTVPTVGDEADPTTAGGTVVVEAHIADLAGVELERQEVRFLLPNRHPYRNALDNSPAKGRSTIVAIDSAPGGTGAVGEPVDVDCVLRDLYGGRSGISFELNATFAGALELIVRDLVVSHLDWKVGDPDPVFRVDLAAIRGRLATLRIGLANLPLDADPEFFVRIERDGDVFDEGLAGETRSITRRPLVLSSLPAGTYRIAARSDSLTLMPVIVVLHEGEDRLIELAIVPDSRVIVRFVPDRGDVPGDLMSLTSLGGLEVRTLGRSMRHPRGFARVSTISAAPLLAEGAPPCDIPGAVDVRYTGLVPGPCTFLLRSNRLEVNLVAGENPLLVFPIRARRLVTFEGASPCDEPHWTAALRVFAPDGLELESYVADFVVQNDGVGETSLELIPGSYRVAMRLPNGRRVDAAFTVDDVIPARVVLR